MIEIIPSEHARNVLQGKRDFTDSEKATLIWNSPIASREEKLESLEELLRTTNGEILIKQIEERLDYERKSFTIEKQVLFKEKIHFCNMRVKRLHGVAIIQGEM